MPAASSFMRAFKGLGKVGAGWSTAGGAALGGVIGGMSDDGSFIGGAMAGAMMGAGGYGLARSGLRGAMVYNKMLGLGASKGQAASAIVRDIGRRSARYIGISTTQAVNPVRSTLKAGGELVEKAVATAQSVSGTVRGAAVKASAAMPSTFSMPSVSMPGAKNIAGQARKAQKAANRRMKNMVMGREAGVRDMTRFATTEVDDALAEVRALGSRFKPRPGPPDMTGTVEDALGEVRGVWAGREAAGAASDRARLQRVAQFAARAGAPKPPPLSPDKQWDALAQSLRPRFPRVV